MLSLVLAKHMGNMLTLDLARTIAREASPSRPFRPELFMPVEKWEGYTFQCERLIGRGREELQYQRLAYLAETRGQACSPDWGKLEELQRIGHHVIFTARNQAGDLAGSVWLYTVDDIDTRKPMVTDDMLYVEPAHRGRLGVKLVQYAERCIFAIGIRSATFHFRSANRADRLARYLGYTPISTRVTKTHDGDSFAAVPTRHKGSTHEPVI